jgi:translation initiation factor IF-2
MSKVRVYELAKQLGVENKDLLKVIAGLGIEVKNHMSAVDEAAAARIVAAVKPPPPAPKKGEAAKKAAAKDEQEHPGERTKPTPAHAPKTAKPAGKVAVAGPAAAGAAPKAPAAHRKPPPPPPPRAKTPPRLPRLSRQARSRMPHRQSHRRRSSSARGFR